MWRWRRRYIIQSAHIPIIHSPTDLQSKDSIYVCLEVSDTGIGSVQSDMEKLFDPFFSSKFIGRGLGLAVVLEIAKAHYGAIAVQNDPGRGSTFRVFLPSSVKNVNEKLS